MKCVLLVVGAFLCLAGCSQPAVAVTVEDLDLECHGFAFEPHEVVLGTAERQTLLTGFFLGDAVADLAVAYLDDQGNRRLRIDAFDGSDWKPSFDATLPPDVLFVDRIELGGRERLLAYTPGRLSWVDLDAESLRTLVVVTSSFDPPRRDEIPHVDVTRDLNGDGRDDLVVPCAVGFRVFVQTATGAFASPVDVGLPPDLKRILGADGYRYDPWSESRVHTIDHDQDDRDDLVYWNGECFAVHVQDERGRFAPRPETFATDVPFETDDLDSLTTGSLTGRVLYTLADLDDDSVGDLVVQVLEGCRISKKSSRYEVHFGQRTPRGGTAFASEIGATFRAEDSLQIGLVPEDLDGDGRLDLMLTTIPLRFLEGSLWKSLKGFMGDDVWLTLEFYRQAGGLGPSAPDATRRIALDGPPSHREPGWVPPDLVLQGGKHERRRTRTSWPRAFNPILLLGDLNGDGRSDQILSAHPRILHVHLGVPGPDLFGPRQEVKLPISNDGEYTWLADLDRDGKQDVVMHYPFVERDGHGTRLRAPGTERQRVRLLLSR